MILDQLRQLNEIVTDLQQQVMKLERQNEYLKGKLEEMDTEARPSAPITGAFFSLFFYFFSSKGVNAPFTPHFSQKRQ